MVVLDPVAGCHPETEKSDCIFIASTPIKKLGELQVQLSCFFLFLFVNFIQAKRHELFSRRLISVHIKAPLCAVRLSTDKTSQLRLFALDVTGQLFVWYYYYYCPFAFLLFPFHKSIRQWITDEWAFVDSLHVGAFAGVDDFIVDTSTDRFILLSVGSDKLISVQLILPLLRFKSEARYLFLSQHFNSF
jgi:hypothetical protein